MATRKLSLQVVTHVPCDDPVHLLYQCEEDHHCKHPTLWFESPFEIPGPHLRGTPSRNSEVHVATRSITIKSPIPAPTATSRMQHAGHAIQPTIMPCTETRHEGFKLAVNDVRSGKLSVETCSESNSMSRQDPLMVPENLRGQASYERPVAHYLSMRMGSRISCFPLTLDLFCMRRQHRCLPCLKAQVH